MITILLQKILAALTQLLGDIKTKLNTIKDNLDNLIVVATATGPIASFTTNLTRPLLSCIVDIPESVSGTDTITVTQTGANLWDGEYENGSLSSVDGTPAIDSTRYRTVNYILVKPNTSYFFKLTSNSYIYEYDENHNYITRNAYNSSSDFTVSSNCHYIKFTSLRTGFDVNSTSINFPSTDTTYHAHVTATTKTVSLPSTVYGGEVDIINGNITKTYDTEDLGDLTWSFESDVGYFYSDSITSIKSDSVNCLCESGYTYDEDLSADKTFTVSGTQIRFRDDLYSAAPDFKTAVTGIDFIYELAEADTDTITPEVITAKNGINNIFSDSGNVTVEYLKKYKED